MQRFIRFFLGSMLGGLLILPTAYADQTTENEGGCYGYLTDLVRSSNFPFLYVIKDKVNLLIDDDDGESVSAQLFYDTDGSGVIGWIKYTPATQSLLNTSAELDEPVALSFDSRFAEGYSHCLARPHAG
ncbi:MULTISPECIES: hypothetical protein [unclassified Pseudomonas]|uniref:hypothetical protein n=1 Tax=unclassified Pseudomonas TaxID=196821 RepID=UPI0019129E51|nr:MULTISPECIES: hypothetical protein [unclassified Pseudomonas]MBK5549053.1 hypothetical protein [Pseudomonas sp. TH03]MEB0225367.1 hypothetical protein [Pseudomonas sp. 5S1]MEB0298076.1 hypothetical protein [Pseudomonas sp. 10S4]WPX19805.1 hypothetical protein RHM58_07470 [Pseudomonas sp. 10S4]